MPHTNTASTDYVFKRDSATEPTEKNALLAGYLAEAWNDLDIVMIERIENGDSGWKATYSVKVQS
jgi:hypothetical protein